MELNAKKPVMPLGNNKETAFIFTRDTQGQRKERTWDLEKAGHDESAK